MEFFQISMNTVNRIYEEEAEKASYAYLMSTVIVIIGLPMPIINVIANVIFYWANRRKTYFVRFHCLQSMLSQLSVIPLNSIGVGWTISILTGHAQVSNLYIAYIITIIGFNIVEFIASLYAAVQVRKKTDVRFWLFGPMTELFCKPLIVVSNPETKE
jgi:uncharacterized membrane protein